MAEDVRTFEKLRLTPNMVSAWYGSTLIGGSPAKTPASPPADTPGPMPVEVRKEVLIFLRPLPPAVSERGMAFLSDILKACQLSLDEVALFEGPGPGDLESLRTTCDPRAMILFGIDPAATGLPLHIPHFQVMEHGGIKLLSSPPVEDMFDDKVLKSQLWVGLKKIFL
jgi:hypothetical protein